MLLRLTLNSLVFLGFLSIPFYCDAQNLDTTNIITTVDFRGISLDEAILATAKITENNYVVIFIKGGDNVFHKEIEGHLKALIHNGYQRLGLVLADLESNEQHAVIAVFSDGTLYAVVKQAKADLETGWNIYNLVRDAYQEHILPKMNKINRAGKSN
jgi:hypothetical protein